MGVIEVGLFPVFYSQLRDQTRQMHVMLPSLRLLRLYKDDLIKEKKRNPKCLLE